jgi:hypothetical protein
MQHTVQFINMGIKKPLLPGDSIVIECGKDTRHEMKVLEGPWLFYEGKKWAWRMLGEDHLFMERTDVN